ncbi:MAG: hypothetical protein KRP56_03030 [Candidatus Methanogranum gryphiswaldense]|nr:MAG: hypothetical protein KRP56_03030 [Candidatus Methanogranum sp. U3.2.1]
MIVENIVSSESEKICNEKERTKIVNLKIDQSKVKMFIAIMDGFSKCHNVSFDDTIRNEKVANEIEKEIEVLVSKYSVVRKMDPKIIPQFIEQIYPDLKEKIISISVKEESVGTGW